MTENTNQQGGQSSSSQGGQSQSGGTAQGGASEQNKGQQQNQNSGQQQSAQGGGQQQGGEQQQQQKQQAPQRPTYVRDDEWDAVNGKIIDAKLEGRINGLTAFEAAEQSRKLSIPKPEAYAVELPKDFKRPEGVTFELNKDDPIIVQARTLANKRGLDQEGFSEFLGLYAATKVGEQQQFKAAFDAEVGKLGANATARVTAVQTWLKAMGGQEAEPLAKVLAIAPVADTIVALENLMKKFAGGTGFNQLGRESQPAPLSDEKWNSMSYAEKRAYGKREKAA